MPDVVIAAYKRSPFHLANRGALVRTRPDDLAAEIIKALMASCPVDPNDVEDLILGCAFPEGEQGLNVARLISFMAGLPISAGGVTVNRFCGSSMQSIHQAAGAIMMGAGEVFVCAGVESMSRIPMMGFNPLPHPGLMKAFPTALVSMGETAENVATRHQIPRADQEAFAVRSQTKTAAAIAAGRFVDEIVPVGGVTADGCPRPETTAASLAGLKPAFRADGTVTAGTSSPLTDGAAAVIVCTADYAKAHGITPMAIVRSVAVSGCAPDIMGMGPVGAARKAMKRAGITAAELDVVELNEAFASQALACMAELGLDEAKVNLDGGAIALGHPLGATGARITGKAASLLVRTGGRFALATQCIGGGQGIATILEHVA
ncbi:MAG: thiolase family protein [Acetobacteraceae bacterium]|nr:thiolase family protein [Acetobacteraceae bacterium]